MSVNPRAIEQLSYHMCDKYGQRIVVRLGDRRFHIRLDHELEEIQPNMSYAEYRKLK